MADALKDEFVLPPEPPLPELPEALQAIEVDVLANISPAPVATAETPSEEPAARIGPHAQHRLAAYAAFEEARTRSREDLARIAQALASINAAHHMSQDFASDCYGEIHRANELENANAALGAENRRLAERADKLERLRGRYDQLIEVLKKREARLVAEAEGLRESVGDLRLELVEARNAIARLESQQGELQTSLVSRGNEAERYLREAEILREKSIGLSVELDLAQKKQSESRRRAEELSTLHAADSARLAELMGRLVAEESENTRLQKLNDALDAKLVEANESAARLASELGERDRRHQSEAHALRAELQALNARLQSAAAEQRDAADGLTGMRSRVNELETDKQVLEKKLVALARELDTERRAASAAANEDRRGQETELLRAEIAELQATVARLRQNEVAPPSPKMRVRKADAGAATFEAAGTAVPHGAPVL